MAYATLMVHIDIDRSSERRVRLAVGLARRFGAALIGISGWAPRPAMVAPGIIVDPATIEREFETMKARLHEHERRFRAQADQVEAIEWRGGLDFPADLILKECRAADLIVLGRDQAPGDFYFTVDPGSIVLQAGRPVLLVPEPVDSLSARRVVIAWKDTRESRRAIRDALPLLRDADEILVAAVCEQGSEDETRRDLDDVARYLARHRLTVGAKAILHAKAPAGTELLRFAENEKADLIVAGGYGHARLREWVFGGVTQAFLSGSPVCCLLSH